MVQTFCSSVLVLKITFQSVPGVLLKDARETFNIKRFTVRDLWKSIEFLPKAWKLQCKNEQICLPLGTVESSQAWCVWCLVGCKVPTFQMIYFAGENLTNYHNASCGDKPDKPFEKTNILAGKKCSHINFPWLSVCRCCLKIRPISPPFINGTVSCQLCYAIWLSEIFISCVKTDPLWSLTQRQRSASLPHINTLYLGSISGVMFYCYVALWMGLFNVAGRWGALPA